MDWLINLGNVFLLPFEDDVAELFLRFGCYCSVSGKHCAIGLPDTTANFGL